MTRHEIQVLRAAGIAEQVVAQRTAVSVRSVERISQEPPVTGPIRTVRVGRPALTAAWADQVVGWLTEDRALPGMEILRRAHEAGFDQVLVKNALQERAPEIVEELTASVE